MKPPEMGELSRAMFNGYRVAVHDKFFPWTNLDGVIVHAHIDHGARAVFCSREWFDSLPKTKEAAHG